MATFLPRGATLQHWRVAGTDLVHGFAAPADYAHNTPFFGETIGRVANRIAAARATLNGRAVVLAANDPPNALHGGPRGWGKQDWAEEEIVRVSAVPGLDPPLADARAVRYTLRSPHGDEGYPGAVRAAVTYTTGRQGAVDVVAMEYEVVWDEDDTQNNDDAATETVVNLTNHSYFTLDPAAPTVDATVVELATNVHLPLDAHGIPTGTPAVCADVPPPHTPFRLGDVRPLDDCFVVRTDDPDDPDDAHTALDTRARPLTRLVAARHPATGLHLEVLSTEPAFQLYTGDGVDVPAVGGLPARGPRCGFCVEPSRFVDAVNVPAWRPSVVLPRGGVYGSRTVYRAWKEES